MHIIRTYLGEMSEERARYFKLDYRPFETQFEAELSSPTCRYVALCWTAPEWVALDPDAPKKHADKFEEGFRRTVEAEAKLSEKEAPDAAI